MSEKNDQLTPQEIAKHPAIEELLERLRVQFGVEFFIVGAGTPEQEAEHKAYVEKQEARRREEEREYAKTHAASPEIIQMLIRCLVHQDKRS